MKITGIEVIILQRKSETAIRDAIHTFADPVTLVTKVHTDSGITGWATTHFGTSQAAAQVMKVTLEHELAPVIAGENPFFAKAIREKLWNATEYHAVHGITHWAIAAIDLCLWDIVGKALQKPVSQVLGAHRDRIPAYAMVGWYFDDIEWFKEQCAAAVEQGFRAVKIKVGRGSIDEDVRRFEAAREAVGPSVRIMVDANQTFNEAEALQRGRIYQELGAYWYEEPLPPHQDEALARLAEQLDIPIASGENHYTKYAFLNLFRLGAVDIAQPDNRRAGGVTEWMEIGALAAAYNIPVASHGGGPANVHMLCAMPTAIYLESGLRSADEPHVVPLRMEDGCVICPDEPGLGTELRSDYVEKYRIDR